MTINLTEIFSSIQGEGPFMGRPAVFIRLSGCIPPLCPWCDTIHACSPGKKTRVDHILSRVLDLGSSLVVITGGEPFLQWDSGLGRLESALLDKGIFIQYETSGKILIPGTSQGFKVCSPKYIRGQWYFVSENIHQADAFKFVVTDDCSQVIDFVTAHALPRKKVWIMPLGASREAQLRRTPQVWNFCAENKFNFSPRLHTLAFNNKRGI